MKMQKQAELYRGKAKTVYSTENPDLLVLEFRNDTSAGDGARIEQFDRKGMVNNKFNHFIMSKLEEAGIPTQMEALLSDTECLVKKLDMVPVECVVRNRAAGSLVKRLGIEDAGLILVDFKLAFGLYKGEVVLGDEFSPDGSRLWDKETLDKMDKDRFRQSLGGVIEAYEAVAHRLGVKLD